MKKVYWPYYIIILSIILIFLFLIKDILFPFVVAFILTYIINPYVDKLEKLKIPRTYAAGLVILTFFTLLIVCILVIIPPLYKESISFLRTVPEIRKLFQEKLNQILPKMDSYFVVENVKQYGEQIASYSINFISAILTNLWASGLAVVNLLALTFITPVITFYLIRDWKYITNSISSLIPASHFLHNELNTLNVTLGKYLSGQVKICIIIGLYNSILLSALKLNYSLFIGITTGILSFIPYVGSIFCILVSNIIGIIQFSSHLKLLLLMNLFFLIGNILETTVFSPLLVGESVNLHPVWIIFSLFSGGAICGLIGMLLAVPIAATLNIFIRASIKHYFKKNGAIKPAISS